MIRSNLKRTQFVTKICMKKTSIVAYFTLLTYYCRKLRKITNYSHSKSIHYIIHS